MSRMKTLLQEFEQQWNDREIAGSITRKGWETMLSEEERDCVLATSSTMGQGAIDGIKAWLEKVKETLDD